MCAERRVADPAKPEKTRIAVLDGLRLLAATMVVMYHYAGVSNAQIGNQGRTESGAWGRPAATVFPPVVHQIAMYGWTGVELFFMISGFVICMSGWGRRPADFFVSRVVRLVPAYWAAVGLTALVLMVFPRLSSGVRPSVVLTNLSMVQSAYGVPNLVPAFWTLFVELTFYLLFGLVAIGGVTYRRMVTFCVVWSVASIAVSGSHDAVLRTLVHPPYSAYFVAGIGFFLIHKFGGNLLLWGIVTYSWLIAVNQPRNGAPWPLTVVLSSFFVIMALIATHRLDRIRWRWLPVAGALTYPLYLIHQDIGFTAIAYLRDRVPATALVVLTYAAMLGVAWAIHRAVEQPVAPLLRARLSEAVTRVISGGPRIAPSPPAPPPAAPSPATPSSVVSWSAVPSSAGARAAARWMAQLTPDNAPAARPAAAAGPPSATPAERERAAARSTGRERAAARSTGRERAAGRSAERESAPVRPAERERAGAGSRSAERERQAAGRATAGRAVAGTD